ncbi:unnamed protein product [Protopolystoma xenopodis]|uniref:Uncharacterized protein n=1 Tax=Protopolystoma xenopodis TaxID=117903 RepID=A0A3S5B9K4_9PLAT|nr:unnamed protein product [Protopolystoma xenopodis]
MLKESRRVLIAFKYAVLRGLEQQRRLDALAKESSAKDCPTCTNEANKPEETEAAAASNDFKTRPPALWSAVLICWSHGCNPVAIAWPVLLSSGLWVRVPLGVLADVDNLKKKPMSPLVHAWPFAETKLLAPVSCRLNHDDGKARTFIASVDSLSVDKALQAVSESSCPD